MGTRRRAAALLAATVLVGGLVGCGEQSWEKRCTTTAQLVIECAPDQRPQVSDVTGELLGGGRYDGRVISEAGPLQGPEVWALRGRCPLGAR